MYLYLSRNRPICDARCIPLFGPPAQNAVNRQPLTPRRQALGGFPGEELGERPDSGTPGLPLSSGTMSNNETPQSQIRQQVSHDEISRRAEELWRQYGSPQGRDEEIWLEAERQLQGVPSDQASSPASEGVGSSQSSGSSSSAVPPAAQKPQDTELMERSSPPAAPRGSKSRSQKSSGK